ncbi:MAG: TIGR00730 family Rossman fold protein [Pseudomonadota bacterium]
MPHGTATSVCVYCGSRFGQDRRYRAAAEATGRAIAGAGMRLVFGGGTQGLMGAAAGAARDAGGSVLGVIPTFLREKEGLLEGISHDVVETMHERKIRMFDASDAFCVLPGGIGTLEEMVEVISWSSLALHRKPVILLNVAGYWDRFVDLIEHVAGEGFAYPGLQDTLIVIEKPADLVATVEAHRQQVGVEEKRSTA